MGLLWREIRLARQMGRLAVREARQEAEQRRARAAKPAVGPLFWRGARYGLLFVAPFWVIVGYLVWLYL